MGKKAIVFIDDSNFYHNIKKVGLKSSWIDFEKLTDFICSKFNVERLETRFYSSVPSIEDGADNYYKQIKVFQDWESLPRTKVQKRKLQRLSTDEIKEKQLEIIKTLNLCKKCIPEVEAGFIKSIGKVQRREKGIDVLLAVEMISFAIKKECDCCILISGDADFLPAMDLVKEHGIQVISAFIKCSGYSSEIRTSKHQIMYLTYDILCQCLKPEKKNNISK